MTNLRVISDHSISRFKSTRESEGGRGREIKRNAGSYYSIYLHTAKLQNIISAAYYKNAREWKSV